MNENTPQGGHDDASRDRYDFQRLERSVEYLLEEHARLGAEREAILAELADREHRVSALEAEVRDERRRRAVAVEGVDKILSRLEQLQSSVGFSDGAHSAANADGKDAQAAAQQGGSGGTQ